MKNTRTIIFIGPLRLGVTPNAGDTMKNQMLYDRFRNVYDKVLIVDTYNWRKRPWVLLHMMTLLFSHRHSKVIVSTNTDSAYKLLRIIKSLQLPNDCFYSVIGGAFANRLKHGEFSLSVYHFLKGIFVEGESMVNTLKSLGLTNVICMPNTKIIEHYGEKKLQGDGVTHFVFLSRIEESKGCTDILKCVEPLNNAGYKNRYDIVFYGKESDDAAYFSKFKAMVEECDGVEYRGLLDLRDYRNYDVLAQYDVMLFPTYWHGEGFPGIVIDAYIASLPIIASDWSLNRDIIEDGITGWIIPPHDVRALAEQMKYVIDHPKEIFRLSRNCRIRAAQYDTRAVYSDDNLKRIGML